MWQDRLRKAFYVSPSGEKLPFLYENVKQTQTLRGSSFEFPDADGTFVQRIGNSGRRFPLRIILSGSDYDIQAGKFNKALLESGVGSLEHPIYGVIKVIPLGELERIDNLKTAANQAIFEVTFFETTGLLYPTSQKDGVNETKEAVDDYNEAESEALEDNTILDTANDRANFLNDYNNAKAAFTTQLSKIAAETEEVEKQFNAINDSINNGIDELIADPLLLGFQTVLLIQSPARAASLILDRLDAYTSLVGLIVGKEPAIAGLDNSASNSFHNDDLYCSAYITGQVVSVINNQFQTKSDAIAAADVILTNFDNYTAWHDDNFESLNELDTSAAYQNLLKAVSLAAGFLVQISFSLKQERKIILDRNRSIIDLTYELYGEVDLNLDFFINSNNLTGDEILELPKGKEIVFYV